MFKWCRMFIKGHFLDEKPPWAGITTDPENLLPSPSSCILSSTVHLPALDRNVNWKLFHWCGNLAIHFLCSVIYWSQWPFSTGATMASLNDQEEKGIIEFIHKGLKEGLTSLTDKVTNLTDRSGAFLCALQTGAELAVRKLLWSSAIKQQERDKRNSKETSLYHFLSKLLTPHSSVQHCLGGNNYPRSHII